MDQFFLKEDYVKAIVWSFLVDSSMILETIVDESFRKYVLTVCT
jgi:hypothetical protein